MSLFIVALIAWGVATVVIVIRHIVEHKRKLRRKRGELKIGKAMVDRADQVYTYTRPKDAPKKATGTLMTDYTSGYVGFIPDPQEKPDTDLFGLPISNNAPCFGLDDNCDCGGGDE